MVQKKREHPKLKAGLHPRNKHRERYDFTELINACPDLAPKDFAQSCLWFTSLVSKEDNLLRKSLKALQAAEVKTMKMSQGSRTSRILAWTFHDKEQQQAWAKKYWSE